MPIFRKIATIEARQFDPDNDYSAAVEVMEWASMRWAYPDDLRKTKAAIIPTLEDGPNGEAKHWVQPGDWIAKGSAGEFYAIKPDIFAKTYEQVS